MLHTTLHNLRRNAAATSTLSLPLLPLLLSLATLAPPPSAAAPPTGFASEQVLGGFALVTSMAFLPDGRLLVAEKDGQLWLADPASGARQLYMVLDNLETGGERGLLDIIIDSDFENTQHFFVWYQSQTPPSSRVARFTHVENSGGLSSRGALASLVVLWQDADVTSAIYHYGGQLSIGPDNHIYFTMGDKESPSAAQDTSRTAGTAMRIARDGSIPADNFGVQLDGRGQANDAIWAYGLRNPWRARWDLPTGRFLVGEVGGNNQIIAQEDVHIVTAGGNYGWPLCEGSCTNPNFPSCSCSQHQGAIYTYPHQGSNACLIGGFVYRGGRFPTAYDGVYFYADYIRGYVSYLTFSSTDNTKVLKSTVFDPAAGSILHFEPGPAGDIYYSSVNSVRRYVYTASPTAQPKLLSFTATATAGTVPLATTFSVGVAAAPDQPLPDIRMVFGDGSEASALPSATASFTHTYTSPGKYMAYVKLLQPPFTVTSDTLAISVGVPPTISLTAPTSTTFVVGTTVAIVAVAAHPDETLDDSAVTITIELHHDNHFHPLLTGSVGSTAEFKAELLGHYINEGQLSFRITAVATSADGLQASATMEVFPQTREVRLASQPAPVHIRVDGHLLASQTPEQAAAAADPPLRIADGLALHLDALPSLCYGGQRLVFLRWEGVAAPASGVDSPVRDIFASELTTTNGLITAVYGALAEPLLAANATLRCANPCASGARLPDYSGAVSTTAGGRTCQAWAAQQPHQHYYVPAVFPDADLGGGHNACRNIDGRAGGPWCYTADPAMRWERCNICAAESLGSATPTVTASDFDPRLLDDVQPRDDTPNVNPDSETQVIYVQLRALTPTPVPGSQLAPSTPLASDFEGVARTAFDMNPDDAVRGFADRPDSWSARHVRLLLELRTTGARAAALAAAIRQAVSSGALLDALTAGWDGGALSFISLSTVQEPSTSLGVSESSDSHSSSSIVVIVAVVVVAVAVLAVVLVVLVVRMRRKDAAALETSTADSEDDLVTIPPLARSAPQPVESSYHGYSGELGGRGGAPPRATIICDDRQLRRPPLRSGPRPAGPVYAPRYVEPPRDYYRGAPHTHSRVQLLDAYGRPSLRSENNLYLEDDDYGSVSDI